MRKSSVPSRQPVLLVGCLLCGCAAPVAHYHVDVAGSAVAPASVPVAAPPVALAPAPAGTAAATATAAADGAQKDLIQILLDNGTLTAEQAAQVRGTSSAAWEPHDSWRIGSSGLQFQSADGDYSMRIGGRLHLDGNVHGRETGTAEEDIHDGTEIRRARFELRGGLPEDISWWGEVDFADNRVSLKDFRFQKNLGDDEVVSIGHQKQPYSLAVEESSNDLPFVERSVDNYLIIPFVDRAIGVRAQGHSDANFWAVGLFGESVTPTAVDDEGYGAVARLVHAPVIEDDRIVHLGVRGAYRALEDGAQSIRLRDETTNMSSFSVVDTGTLTGVHDVMLYGPEFAYVNGPFSVGGELNFVDVDLPGADAGFNSWHVYTAYTLTGESRAKAYRIDEGEFKRLRADNPSGRAWELAFRFAELDLTDGVVDGGAEQATNLSLNCYWSNSVRYMLNWTHILDTQGGDGATAAAEDDDIFTIRAQLLF